MFNRGGTSFYECYNGA